jgi:hypothetical protein
MAKAVAAVAAVDIHASRLRLAHLQQEQCLPSRSAQAVLAQLPITPFQTAGLVLLAAL